MNNTHKNAINTDGLGERACGAVPNPAGYGERSAEIIPRHRTDMDTLFGSAYRRGFMRLLALLFAITLCSCSETPKSTKSPMPPLAHSIGADGIPVPDAPEPEVVQLSKVETVDGMMHVTVGNVAGDYVLVCSPDANKESGVQSCLAPRPQQNYLLFRRDTKWFIKGAKQPLNLDFMRRFSVTYNYGENIGLLPARNTEEESFRVYWLLSWTAKHPVR